MNNCRGTYKDSEDVKMQKPSDTTSRVAIRNWSAYIDAYLGRCVSWAHTKSFVTKNANCNLHPWFKRLCVIGNIMEAVLQ
jgi:hypothetical protein